MPAEPHPAPAHRRGVPRPTLAAGLALAGVLAACAPEERVVAVRGGFHSLEGVDSQLKLEARSTVSAPTSWDAILDRYYDADDELPGEPAPGYPNRREMADGSYYLITRSPRDLIIHLYETLNAGEFEMMYEQLLAERTKQAYRDEGLDPVEAGKYVVRNREHVIKLLELMPGGEATPGVFMKSTPGKTYVLSVPNAGAVSSKYSELEFTIEDGRFVLVMLR